MKKLLLILTIAITLFACNEKEDIEPNTLHGTWEVDSYNENGVDMTTQYKATYVNYKIKFDRSNNFIETYTLLGANTTNAGEWKLINSGEDLELTSQVDNSKRYFNILELNPSSATITEDNGSKEYNLRKI